MSFLTPLYFLGLAAVAAPIVFHLIRRSPKGEVPFSSLMFLTATPPRLTRRSRLDHWLLLALRAAALALLAFAFARPFLREAAAARFRRQGTAADCALVDTSASMRRGDLWTRAQALAGQVRRRLPAHRSTGACLRSIERAGRCWAFTNRRPSTRRQRQTIARAALDRLTPSWGGTEPGTGPGRHGGRGRRRGRHEREGQPDAAPRCTDQRPGPGEPARRTGRAWNGRRMSSSN